MRFMLRSFMASILLLLSSGVALSDTTTFECTYAKYSDEAGSHAEKKPFRLTFLVDSSAEQAYLIGNNGSSKVELVGNPGGFTFVEITGTGNVMVTAITKSGESVHSRTGIMGDVIIPAQYYGRCTIK